MTEIFRAGIQSVAGGQGEAADALGMTYGQKMRKVVLPQAFRVIIPPTGNEFIAMMKDTALVSFLGVTVASAEVFRRAQLVGKADFKNLEAYVAAALVYWGLTVRLHVLPGPAGEADRARLRPGARRAGHAGRARAGPAPRRRRPHRMSRRRGGPHRRAAQELRPPRGGARGRHGGPPRRGGGHLRAVRLRQVDGAALRELHRGPDRGLDRGRRHPARGRAPHPAQARADPPAAAARRHGLPAVQPVPQHDGARQRHSARPAAPGRAPPRSPSGPRTCSTGSAWPTRRGSTRSGSPAASSSASPSPGRWRWSPT